MKYRIEKDTLGEPFDQRRFLSGGGFFFNFLRKNRRSGYQ